jgi:hypothetical protein
MGIIKFFMSWFGSRALGDVALEGWSLNFGIDFANTAITDHIKWYL